MEENKVIEENIVEENIVEEKVVEENSGKEKRTAIIVLAAACTLAVASIFLGIFLWVVPAVKRGAESLEARINGGVVNFGALDTDDMINEFMSELTDQIASGESSGVMFPGQTQTFGDITGLEIDMSIGKVTVVSGSENKVTILGVDEKFCPEVTCEDGVLYIGHQDEGGIVVHGGIKDIKESARSFKASVEITVKDQLSSFKCNTDIGDVNIDGITADDFELDVDCGNVVIQNCSFGKNCALDVDLGNTEIIKCEFNNMTINVDMGNVTVETKGNPEDYTVEADVDLGAVKVFDIDEGKSADIGSGPRRITAECSMGAILIK